MGNALTETDPNQYVTTCQYDYLSLLTQVLYKTASGAVGKSVEYEYDPFDRLVRRTADADGVRPGAPETTYYVYDGTEIVLALDATGAVANRYLWAPDVDLILADEQPTGVIWPLADNQGTIRDLAQYDAATGNTALVNHRTYDSFGDLKSQTNAAVEHLFAYTGRFLDELTGDQNHLHRWYDPDIAQWLSEDPIGFAGGDANLKRYVGNSPANYVDRAGLWERGNGTNDRGLGVASDGHTDFYNPGGVFNWYLEDEDHGAQRLRDTYRHFMTLQEAEAGILEAIKNCDREAFERGIHRMQDYYSHRGQGYVSNAKQPIAGAILGGAVGGALTGGPVGAVAGIAVGGVWGASYWGHVGDSARNQYFGGSGLRPDNADDYRNAFDEANSRTEMWVKRWYRCDASPVDYSRYAWAESAPPGNRPKPRPRKLTPAEMDAVIERMYQPPGALRPAGGW